MVGSKGRSNYCKNQLTKFFLASFLLMLAVSVENVRPEDFNYESDPGMLSNNCQLDNILQSLLSSDDDSSIHVKALRQDLLRILNNEALRENLDYEINDDKRSIASLARSNQYPFEYKRNLGSLARSGFLRTGPNKRSIATLAKNGQLPTLQSPEEEIEMETEEEKRGIESLARSGAIHRYLKKSLESLARSGYISGKRNIGALARNGYLKRDIDNFMDHLYQKRYVGSLARQFNLPSGKRNMGALARNGGYSRYLRNNPEDLYDEDKRNVQSLVKSGTMLGGKRNLAALARNQNTPYFGRGADFKRNIGAIARDWALPNQSTSFERTDEEKRNVAALLRQDSYLHSMNRNHAIDAHPTAEMDDGIMFEEKRNLAALKAQATSSYNTYGNRNSKRSVGDQKDDHVTRAKRQADDYFGSSDEYSVPVMQNSNSLDYEEFVNALNDNYPSYRSYDKRFLGSVARGGWFRGGDGGQVRFTPDKRHIGSLARLGWLPSFRYARSRFSRSGRSALPPLEREYSTLEDGRIRQVIPDGPAIDFKYDPNEPDVSQTPISFVENQFRGQRMNNLAYEKFLSDLSDTDAENNMFSDNLQKSTDDPDQELEEISDKRYLLLPAVDNILLRRLYPSYTTIRKTKTT